jgi:methylmalonyl-CoA/ethylmalonyl-CoA epimerase
MAETGQKRTHKRTPPLTHIDHVGVACHDLAEKIAFYESVFGLAVVSQETNEEQGVREAMLRFPLQSPPDRPPGPSGAPSYVQLLQPLGPDTPVGKFLAKRGEGLHHVGYGVRDITAALASFAGSGIKLIDERPRHGSMGASIAFLHPADIGGVLTELVQPRSR